MPVYLTEPFRRSMHNFFGPAAAAWLAQLPAQVADLEERWGIQALEPFLLSVNYVAPAVTSDGRPVVLKLGVPRPDLTRECDALRFYNGRGMVRLLREEIEQGAMLLERLQPGRMLIDVQAVDDDRATMIAAGLLADVWQPLPPGHPFQTAADWVADFQELRARHNGSTGPLPERRVERAEGLFRELQASAGPAVLLHGDFHHYNILSDGDGWRVIDPLAVVGDPGFEIGAFLLNPWEALPNGAELHRLLHRRLDLFGERLGLDRQALQAWSEIRVMVSAWWSVEDSEDPSHALMVADALEAGSP